MSGWIALDKRLAGTFHEIHRKYSKIEAMYSLSLDINCGKIRSLRSYSRMWEWSTKKVKRFLSLHGTEETERKQRGNTKETLYTIILLGNNNTEKQKGNSEETLRKHKYKEQEQEQYKKTMSGKKSRPPIPFKKIIAYFNERASSNFKYQTQTTQAHIRARVNEGFKEQDFYDVIDQKVDEWEGNEKMLRYIRPQTLFGTKFESYLQEAKNGAANNESEIKKLVKKVLANDKIQHATDGQRSIT